MGRKEKELAVVVGYIMHYSLFDGTRYSGSYFATIDYALLVAEEFLKVYPYNYVWGTELEWDETLEDWVRINAESIIEAELKSRLG